MSVFNVELKKVVDDSYDIEIGYNLKDQLVDDLETGLLGSTKKLAVITDSNVRDLYAKPICEKLIHAGYRVDLFVFPAGEKSKTRKTKERIEDAMLEKGYRRDCAIIAIGGGISKEGDYLIEPIREYVYNTGFNKHMTKTKIVAAQLFNDAGIIGAAMLAI